MKFLPCLSQPLRGLALLLTALPLGLHAQQTGPAQVSGTVQEAAGGQPVPFADVLLLRAADSTLVTGTQTGLDGTFRAEHLALGRYILRTQALNFKPQRRVLALTAEAPSVALGPLRLAAAATQLGEVRVVAQKAIVQQELGKTVINVEKDLSSVGGTAVNVLQNVPSVAVDATGTVSLRGSSNLTILIDGKPAGTGNGGPGPRLDQIPASQIAQVEVMTNPSAKYDASGAGVINIITKKDKKEGWNGQAALNVANGDKYAPSLSLSRHHGKATWNLGYDGNDQVYRTRTSSTQTARLPDGTGLFTTQAGQGRQRNRNHGLSLGLSYDLTPEQTLSVSVQPHLEHQTETDNQVLTQQTVGAPAVTTQYGQELADVNVKVLETSADYRRTYAAHKGRELTANAGAVLISATIPVTQTLTGGPAPAGFRQDQRVDAQIYFGQADYTRPTAGGKGKLETGLKLVGSRNSGSTAMQVPGTDGELLPDAAHSFDYRFTQVLPAAYATFSQQLSHGWSAQGGLRTEATFLNGGLTDGRASVNRSYVSLFPSATVARELGKEPGQNRLQFSYARRLNRPDFMQQLPLQLYQDPRNYRQGNPALLPEFSHNLELGHQLNLAGGASLTSTVFARFTQNAIQRVRSIDTLATRTANVGVVTQETYLNYGNTANLGLEMTWAQPLTKWWRVSASGSVYRSQIATNAADAANRSALAGTARLANNFTPRKGLDVQLTGNVRSTVLTAQGRQLPTGGLDLALRQQLFQERAALTFRVSDLLNTQVRRTELATPELQTSLYNKYETRVAWLGFTWYIGASKPGKKIDNAPSGGGGFGG
ncbi:outer membrane beta-barrel protein [Hymenobacter caeli]|uniref:Outer membrane receptor protein involved in Fe transport n=1 Tax=Hymenobacter caeli TaxID=2735894 RepID=A0ABX2FKR2_9BACT|nr:outer membrane beta-barrel protein [Hymenobacter caeli]NRT17710.1 outer membrane receptor protein involved in Fe transport [Hymenobacter caeli]